MSKVEVNTLVPATGTTLTLGESGDTIALGSGATVSALSLSDNVLYSTASKGIYLGVTSATASNLLDDYEEGTWTPTYEPVTGAFTSITYDRQSGEYVKIGRLVYVTGRVRTDAVTVGTASGTIRVNGLPFTTDGDSFRGITTIFGSDWGTDRPTFALTPASSTHFSLYRHNEPNNPDTITVADMSTSANTNNIYFNLIYQTT